MSELEIKKRELDDKMAAIADEIRELSGDTALKGLDDMAQVAQTANSEIADQEELLAQVALALENKVSGYERGKKEGYAEALDKRTDLVATANGEYTPTEDSTGFKSVSVNVQSKLAKLIDRSVTEITAEDLQGVTKIGIYAFRSCSNLSNVELPTDIKSIGSYAFSYCTALEEMVLPNGVETIGNSVFDNCISVKKIDLPESLLSIGSGPMVNACMSLEKIIVRATTPPTIQFNTLNNFWSNSIKIVVPYGCGETYKNATNWSVRADQIVEGDV